MAAAPRWKIFDAHRKYQASTHDLAAAAALMAFYGDGATIRDGHRAEDTAWTEGAEVQLAGESYDFVTNTILARRGAR